MKYAPVIIPTLCRYEHLKRCLESLSQCTGAGETEVYIGLDYPAKDSHWDGYNKIKDYLLSVNELKFKKLHVIERTYNHGFGPNGNFACLRNEVFKSYDRLIASEDDNIFSPNFLIYMNKGLEKYFTHKKCISICGYNYHNLDLSKYDKNIYLSREFSAWGYGIWKDKWDDVIEKICTLDYAKSIIESWGNIFTIYKYEPRLLNTVLLNIASKRVFNDTMIVCFQYLNNHYSIFPTLSKVRNLGFDKSGTTIFKIDTNYTNQIIDKNANIALDEIDFSVNPTIQKSISQIFKRSFLMNCLILIRLFFYKFLKFDICYFEMRRRNKSLFQ